jgi:hypothetical protein
VPLGIEVDAAGASDREITDAFAQFAREEGWSFTHLVVTDHWDGWAAFGHGLGLAMLGRLPDDPLAIPLVVASRAEAGEAVWQDAVGHLEHTGRGLSFALHQDTTAPPADVFGRLGNQTVAIDLAFAVEAAQHPAGKLAGRILRTAER